MGTRKDRIWDKSVRFCPVCNENYIPVRKSQKFCPSPRRCRYTAKARDMSKANYVTLSVCTVCGNEYVPRASNQITCGIHCPGRPIIQKICAHAFCGKEFIVSRTYSPNRQIYCSWECRRKEEAFQRYSISSHKYIELLNNQAGVCIGCLEPPEEGRRLVIDHDHACCSRGASCGKCIRGLLHLECNITEGFFKDNPDRLLHLAKYLSEK